MGSPPDRRAGIRALVALAACAGCDGSRPVSDGSRYAELRAWTMEVGADGAPRIEWLVPGGGVLEADALSVTLVATTEVGLRMAFEIYNDADKMLVDPARSEWSPNRSLSSRGVAVAMLPSASGTLPLGANFRVGAHLLEALPGAGLPMVTAFVKRPVLDGGPVPMLQELPIVVVKVGAAPPRPGQLRKALDELGRIWLGGGVLIRELPEQQLNATDGSRFERLAVDPGLGSDSPELGKLLALSSKVVGPGVERPLVVFLVNDIVAGPGVGIWAIAGGVPVPPIAGTRRSGVVVNGTVVDLDPGRAAQVLAHEIGHALGLYHTTEGAFARAMAGARPEPIHDQLDDTPACPRESDGSGDSVLTPNECETHDGRNLMFWAGTRGSTGITAGQADIARRSALTR
jgi:hypothetical protein